MLGQKVISSHFQVIASSLQFLLVIYALALVSCTEYCPNAKSTPKQCVENLDEFAPLDGGVETGLEFLEDGFRIQFDEDLYMQDGERDKFSFLELTRLLIRNIKGLTGDFPREEDENALRGLGDKQKPSWCFNPYRLKYLAKVEVDIYKTLKEMHKMSELGSSPVLASYFKDIEASSLRAISLLEKSKTYAKAVLTAETEDPYMYIGTHPLMVYRMIRRFAEDLPPIFTALEKQTGMLNVIFNSVNPQGLPFPTYDDLKDALESLIRVQKATELKTEELARGKIEKVETHIQLNALQQLEVGAAMLHFKNEEFDYSIEWINMALETVRKSPIVKRYPVIETYFSMALQHSVKAHNKAWPSLRNNYWHGTVFNTPVEFPFDPSLYTRMHHARYEEASRLRHQTEWNWAIAKNFIRVCSGENLQSEELKALLKCWHERRRHPYWAINPLKVELLSWDPAVYQIYDFIGNNMTEKIRLEAMSNLERSTVVDRDHPTKSVVDKTRTSSQVWIYDDKENGAFMRQVTRRMELMSLLVITPPTAADAFQVACYGISHHYEPHIDSFEDVRRTVNKGNRITTIMGYLGDVPAGGRTGFPIAGIAAEPIKGSVVMWDSTKRNGQERDMRTWHGGCPVALGVKWITNKWVYYNDNFRHYPCDLDPDI